MDAELLISNGRVVDGTGSHAFRADVAVCADRIAFVGETSGFAARRTIDARGRVVCPGFIDVHGHSDLVLLAEPHHAPKVMQGVTTEVIGQDGLSYAPLTDRTMPHLRQALKGLCGDPPGLAWDWRTVGEYLDRFDGKAAVNVAFLAPHGTIRAAAMGLENRLPDERELAEMTRLADRAMQEGAAGLSTGLTYAPCSYADRRELIELCRVVGRHGGYFAPHMRCYGARMEQALEEVMEIAAEAEVPLHLTHFHVSFPTGRGKADDYLARIDRARREGIEVTLDAYPYLAGSTFLAGLLPGWAHQGGPPELVRRLADRPTRDRLRHEMEVTGSDGLSGVPADWETIVLTGVAGQRNRGLVGLNFRQVSERLGKLPLDCLADLLIEEELAVSGLIFCGHEENLRKIMQDPALMFATDGLLIGDRPHPRAWGTFPRILAVYVRQLGILTLEEAVRKMTALPARRLGLRDRGVLRPGMAADLVIFDPDTVRDTATYEDPKRHPEGMPWVIVNGQVVKDDGQPTGALPGRALRRTDS